MYLEVAMVHICGGQFPPRYPSELPHLRSFCRGNGRPIPRHWDKTETQEAVKHQCL